MLGFLVGCGAGYWDVGWVSGMLDELVGWWDVGRVSGCWLKKCWVGWLDMWVGWRNVVLDSGMLGKLMECKVG